MFIGNHLLLAMEKLKKGQIWVPNSKISGAWPRQIISVADNLVMWNYTGDNKMVYDIDCTKYEFLAWVNRNQAEY